MEIYTPIVEHMKIQIRMNPKKRCVELKVRGECEKRGERSAGQRGQRRAQAISSLRTGHQLWRVQPLTLCAPSLCAVALPDVPGDDACLRDSEVG